MSAEKTKVWSVEYEIGEHTFAMHIAGTQQEAEEHANNLGLGTPEPVNQIVQYDFELRESLAN